MPRLKKEGFGVWTLERMLWLHGRVSTQPSKSNSPIPTSGYRALRDFRHSYPGAEYFVTSNLLHRGQGLEAPDLTDAILGRWHELEALGVWHVRTGTVMPDHIHLDFVLGESVDLAEAMRQFKGPISAALREAGLKWQDGYYERRLRETDDRLLVFKYIFLNPYEKKLIPRTESWPGYYCCPEDWAWFGQLTDSDCPLPEWLSW